ncbi:MAG TPA: MaoC/PaaZ C-terminal domain-containing protein [Kofleriaceae bacterium]|nr:MaoC/PaaZ C-terminal domain-containing protein [Kofleriaceae bacterium]
MIASLGQTALAAALQRFRPNGAAPELPGPVIETTLPPRAPELIRDYVRHVGGDPAAYKKTVPPHMFPQWGFPLAAQTLRGVPYPLMRVMNGGCRLEVRAPLPAGERLHVRVRLEGIDDDGRRAVLHQRVTTGTESVPEAIIGDLYAIVPLGGANGEAPQKARKDKARVPGDARELAYWRIPADAGLTFAMLTGDFNPIHWVRPYARASGFKSTILHGFATMARAAEGLNRAVFSGDVTRLAVLDVKFTRPLTLPARVGLYVQGDQVFVGDAPGGPAYLVGSFTSKELDNE